MLQNAPFPSTKVKTISGEGHTLYHRQVRKGKPDTLKPYCRNMSVLLGPYPDFTPSRFLTAGPVTHTPKHGYVYDCRYQFIGLPGMTRL